MTIEVRYLGSDSAPIPHALGWQTYVIAERRDLMTGSRAATIATAATTDRPDHEHPYSAGMTSSGASGRFQRVMIVANP